MGVIKRDTRSLDYSSFRGYKTEGCLVAVRYRV